MPISIFQEAFGKNIFFQLQENSLKAKKQIKEIMEKEMNEKMIAKLLEEDKLLEQERERNTTFLCVNCEKKFKIDEDCIEL